MTIMKGVRGRIRNKALDLNILPDVEVPTFVSGKFVPWVNWTKLSSTSEGVTDFLGSFYSYDTTTFQIINNTDSILYITGGIPERESLVSGPEVIIGPFKGANVTLSSSSVTILARCYGYDFTTKRTIRGFLDTRGDSAYIEIRGLLRRDNPPLPTLRSSWLRVYDLYDLTYNGNPLPNPQITNTVWLSSALDFSGAVSVYLNVSATASAVPNNGSNMVVYVAYSGIATGLGNWNAGGTNLVTQVGFNYITNATVTLAANKPFLELFFTIGDLSGAQVVYNDLWVAGEVTA